MPSWTDRVLFKSTRHASLLSYGALHGDLGLAKHSDHRPVFATFEVSARRAVAETLFSPGAAAPGLSSNHAPRE